MGRIGPDDWRREEGGVESGGGAAPGPWEIRPCLGGYLIESGSRRVVRGAGGARFLEDARLIAAAPELVAACELAMLALKAVVRAVPVGPDADTDIGTLDLAERAEAALEAAIAKARGAA